MTNEDKERLKLIETELAYLRKIIEQYIKDKPTETHQHYHYDYSNMKPMVINDMKGIQKYLDEPPMC